MASAHPLARPNNFHGIRLLAALQVALLHAVFHLQPPTSPGIDALLSFCRLFPGVPIFFFVSGLLVSASYDRHADVPAFARTRLARVMPGLWMCFAATVAGLALAGVLRSTLLRRPGFWVWCAAQLTVGQAYNPDFFRPVGVGVVNGSLWTIAVELGFYGCLPAMMRLRPPRSGWRGWVPLGTLAVGTVAADFVVAYGSLPPLWRKALTVTPLAHADLFVAGMLAYQALPRILRWVEGRAIPWTLVYVGAMALHQRAPDQAAAFVLVRLALPPFVLACALTARRWSDALLGDTDLSYGLYLYHMLMVNLCVSLPWMHRWTAVATVLTVSIAAGLLSWHVVEQPAMRWMRRGARAPVMQGSR